MISSSPELTELLFQLGQGSRLVGTVQPALSPPEAERIPSVGFLYQPSIEATLRLRPDLVVVDRSLNQLSYEANLEALGILTVPLQLSDLASLEKAVHTLLKLFGEEKNSFLSTYRSCVRDLQRQNSSQQKRFSFLALTWTDPPIAYGHTSFISDLLTQLGGTNSLPTHLRHPYPTLSQEWMILHPPDVIYFMTQAPGDEENSRAKITAWWPRFSGKAVPLPADLFGRATFTPFRHLEKLGLSRPIPESCLAL